MKHNLINLLLTSFLLTFFVNCAFTEGTIKTNYNIPLLKEKSPQKMMLVFAKSDDSPETFRDGIYREGIKKNGYGMETANMFTDPKGPVILKKILTLELQNAGIEIINKADSSDIPELKVEVLKLFMEPEVGFFAGDIVTVTDANIYLKIKGKTYKRRFTGIGEETTIMGTDYFFENSLQKSLEAFTRKTVPEVIKLLNEKNR
ncbi:hypothetical protein EHQ30_06525 [Leptospira brenneri]|uniref:Lipoprotein n=1 Tax=Leptospira brenneri TaxID=2023182 RepID=A0A5F1Z9U2_9LEPT|nr:YajG family lipoprotein [Leptospira brenneri]TGK96256.1 hypothetical protein EHQ30_06525 [Leptospira brenneri]